MIINSQKWFLCKLWRLGDENPTISEDFTKTNQKWPRVECNRIEVFVTSGVASKFSRVMSDPCKSLGLFDGFSVACVAGVERGGRGSW